MSRPATPKQVRFIESLFAQCEQALSALDADTTGALIERISTVQSTIVDALAGHEIDMADASSTIELLMAVQREAKAMVPAPDTPPGIAEAKAERWMPNRYANACGFCGEQVGEQQGYVLLVNRRWVPMCSTCANTTSVEREERAEARRIAIVEWQAMATSVLDALGRGEQSRPNVGLAVTDPSGQNDLLFYRLVRRSDAPVLYRVLGGRDDSPIEVERSIEVVRAITDVEGAARTFGIELGQCCLCGRELTDAASRALGIGPDCARRF